MIACLLRLHNIFIAVSNDWRAFSRRWSYKIVLIIIDIDNIDDGGDNNYRNITGYLVDSSTSPNVSTSGTSVSFLKSGSLTVPLCGRFGFPDSFVNV